MMSSSSSSNLNLFTAAQWEELEQQALIYKYMVSGVPVPTHLILSVRRSLFNNTTCNNNTINSSSFFPNSSPNLGVWEGNFQYNQLYQIGGRKIDLEPGRCRRTDGKKWRCSKEAYPDSKYCERHMHRGRNRSRKPVEFSPSSSSSSSSSSTVINASSSPLTTVNISKSISPSDLTYHNNSLHTRSSPIQTNFMDYRYLQDERANYFQVNDAYATQQKMNSSDHHQNYSHFNFQNLKNNKEVENGEHCFVMGTDFVKSEGEIKSSIQMDTKVDEITTNATNANNKQQPFHHFFAPQKGNESGNWVEVEQHQSLISQPKSPLSTQDLFQSKPRPYW